MLKQEHPNPIFKRKNWMNLNGEWEFEIDSSDSGLDREFYNNGRFSSKINVPFCPESELSGVCMKDFMLAVWYKKIFELRQEDLSNDVIVHFGAVDYQTVVFVNGDKVLEHFGGYSSFSANITEYVKQGENIIVVYARDDVRDNLQPRGKQSESFLSSGCDYSRTTGIWQTVWLEFVPRMHIDNIWIYPNISDGSVVIKASVVGNGVLTAEAYFDGNSCGEGQTQVGFATNTKTVLSAQSMSDEESTSVSQSSSASMSIGAKSSVYLYLKLDSDKIRLWDLGQPNLYDLVLNFGEDKVESYFGLREVKIKGNKFLLNGRSVFQRLVLDQGFYPKGIYTAPDDEAMIRDIKISMAAGFNGARLHEKVFEPRFLYFCDKLGYMVWEEYGNWGLDGSNPLALERMQPEWMEVLERDFNHPSIIGWCPFNETWDFNGREQRKEFIHNIYKLTKAYDSTRPCIDTSGAYHVETDIYDTHDYEQDVALFRSHYESQPNGQKFYDSQGHRQRYLDGLPLMISEYGGIKLKDAVDAIGWGYGEDADNEEDFYKRYEGLTKILLDTSFICGFCYTQLYDIEQEVNGLYAYDRKPKINISKIREVNMIKAKIEE